MTRLVLWGTTGQAKVIAEFAPALGLTITAFVDNDPNAVAPIAGLALLHGQAAFQAWLDGQDADGLAGAAAIGGARGADRLQVLRIFQGAGLETPALVHPTAFAARDAAIGGGAQLLAGAKACAGARIGEGVILNTGASVDHECVVGAGAHVAPGAVLTGRIEVGERAFIGPGAVVLPRLRIGRDSVIGAGSVVTRDVPDGVVAYGSPARVVRAIRHDEDEDAARA